MNQNNRPVEVGENLTRGKVNFRFAQSALMIGLSSYYWSAYGSVSPAESASAYRKLLLIVAVLETSLAIFDLILTYSQHLWLKEHGPGFARNSDLPGRGTINNVSIPASLARLGKFIMCCWITNLVFPRAPCQSDTDVLTGHGCTALHLISYLFVLSLCFAILVCCGTCFALCFFNVTSSRSQFLRQQTETFGSAVLPSAIRAQILARLPETSEPPKDDVCAICLDLGEPEQKWRELTCGHKFHSACVDDYLTRSGVCPLCRKDPLSTDVAAEIGFPIQPTSGAVDPSPAAVAAGAAMGSSTLPLRVTPTFPQTTPIPTFTHPPAIIMPKPDPQPASLR